ncbi:MAG TPA: sulfotransferase [Sphingomicrobium sp.]|nr:sulfotransferase [Sphingomicrobium sp.]
MTAAPASEFRQALDAFNGGDLDRAREIAERGLEQSPSPQLQHLVGLIHCRLGNPEAGVDWLRLASDSDPGNLAFRVMLARALVDAGRALEALDAAIPPEGTTPAELALWHVRAEAAATAGQKDLALQALARLCSAGVGDWRIWRDYAEALSDAERWLEASRAFEQAARLNPQELELQRSLARALARGGRHDQSADELRKWVEASPADAYNRIVLARLFANLGRNAEADAQVNEASRIVSGKDWAGDWQGLLDIATTRSGEIDIELLREIGALLERTSRMELLSELFDAAEAKGIDRDRLGYPAAAVALRTGNAGEAKRLLLLESPDVDPLRWHWMMARIADSLGDSELAFAEAEAMNRSVQDYDRWRRTAKSQLEWVRSLTETLTPEWAGRLTRLPPGDGLAPVLLVGFPRSGTTLLDTFLMGHPDVTVLEEIEFIDPVERILGKIPTLPERSAAELEQARQAYLAEMDLHLPKEHGGLVVDKLPLKLLAIPYLHAMFPDLRIIFAQRHPCDCVLSCFMQAFALNNAMACFLDIGDSAEYYDAILSFWVRARETLGLNVETVIYEKLIDDAEGSLRPVVDFLGLEWKDGLLDHRATAKARGAISTPSFDQVVQPLSDKASGRWRRYEKQLEPVLPLLLPWAERLGYSG